jgi:hypothetical protein
MKMKRDTVMTVLLVIAGIVLAFALFGAGVFWKARINSFDGQHGRKVSTLGKADAVSKK